MNIEKFELEWWLNPYDAIATHNMGSSCCKPMNMQELFELDGVSRDEVMGEIANMSLHYGYFEGMPRLKDAIAGLFETPQIAAENVMVVHGATSANALTCYALCEKGDNVIVVVPSYQQFVSIPAALGCEVRQYVSGPEDGFGINFRRLADMVDGHTKAIFLTSPSNPTGYGMSREELEQLAAIARPVGAYVVCDEIYRGLTEGYAASIVDVYERGISTGGTSKVFSSAGLRIGWIVTRDLGLTHVIKNLRSFNTICESPITELLAAIIIEHKEEVFARNRKICAEGRAALNEWLEGQPHLHLACQSQGSTSFITYDWDIPTKEFCEDLFDKTGALVCHGMCFNMEHGFRIGYGYGDVEYFKAGLAKLAEYTASLSDDLLVG
ncbi:MAG: aminotransferase class I/II-fold pyridoxal phosphate-dependent enzyme [Olsenella sp.]|nr:aminotransferase class I/II-fold pyridoxal phosphate-dependent enzyme [Olsenella sp.]